jgi:hypothetical protein
MSSEAKSYRFTLRQLLTAVLFCSFALAIPNCLGRVAISTRTLDHLWENEEDLTRDDVLRIAGKPHRRDGDDKFHYNVWNDSAFFSDCFMICFDENGNVTSMSF